jgi:hypothetical protein
VVSALHVSIPETVSAPVHAIVTGWLYQPFASVALPGVAETAGPVASYLNGNATTVDVFPALSVQLPGWDTLPASGPLYVTEVQAAIPDVASFPLQLIPIAWLNQPFWSGSRAAVAETPVGAVPSYLTPNAKAAEVLPALSVQTPLGAALPESGPLYVVDVQEAIPEVASPPLQVIPTAWLNQPFESGARAAAAEILVGAVASNLSGSGADAELPA